MTTHLVTTTTIKRERAGSDPNAGQRQALAWLEGQLSFERNLRGMREHHAHAAAAPAASVRHPQESTIDLTAESRKRTAVDWLVKQLAYGNWLNRLHNPEPLVHDSSAA